MRIVHVDILKKASVSDKAELARGQGGIVAGKTNFTYLHVLELLVTFPYHLTYNNSVCLYSEYLTSMESNPC